MIKELSALEVITLFVEDLTATKTFYQDVFGLKVVYEDDVSAVVKLDAILINLLHVAEAPALMEPGAVAGPSAGARMLLTIKVDDTNAICAELQRHGVEILSGPIDRPWRRRTASFADPAGNVWEVAQDIPRPT